MVGDAREVGAFAGSTKVVDVVARSRRCRTVAARLSLTPTLDLVGKIVQFGRGMIEEVSRQMFRQFSTVREEAVGSS
jgi:carbon monoxide dehydrogenase subunit G